MWFIHPIRGYYSYNSYNIHGYYSAFEGNSDICFNLDMRSEISLSKGQILYSTYTGCLK